MKKFKKLVVLFLVAAMTLTMGITAFAVGEKSKLTVKVNESNTLEGQTLSVYKLFDLTVNGDAYGYTVNETYKSAIITALGLEGPQTSDGLYDAISELDGPTSIQNFADAFTTAALQGQLAATQTSPELGKVDTYDFEGLDYGYYLVYQTGTKELQSSLISVDKASVEVNLKGEAPSIEKTADAETVQIGQVVKYTITGTIPDTTGYNQYTYIIHDILTAGLDFTDADGTEPSDTNYQVSVKIGEGTASSQAATLSGDENRQMTLDLSQWVRDNQASKGQQFTVTYYAKVNSAAVVQTNNSASLEYGNEPSHTTTTTPDKVVTPTYPLDIKKTESKNNGYLAGAVFRLYARQEDAEAGNNNAIKVTGSAGNYTVAEDQDTAEDMDMVSSGSEIGGGYNLHLNGLRAGDYWIVETQAPDGYNKITAPIKVTIAKTDDAEWTISKDNVSEDDKIIDVVNSTGTILPETGGIGTIVFTVIGVLLIFGVVVSFVISRKKTNA